VTVRQLIPEGLAKMVPGPELSVLLAGIDIHAVTGADAVEVLRARARQLSHEQARLLATMVEVGLCDPDAGVGEVARLPESPPYAADEIRAALAWTRRAADREHGFAETLVLRMPAVFIALDTGQTRIRELGARHGCVDDDRCPLTWDDGGYHATIIRVERTPIRWTGYAVCAGYGGWWESARRIRR